MRGSSLRGAAVAVLAALALPSAPTLRVDVSPARSQGDAYELVDRAMRDLTRNGAILTRRERTLRGLSAPVSFPQTVVLHSRGVDLPMPQGGRGRGPGIVLRFDDSGSQRTFPRDYRDFLQAVFNRAEATMNVVFGEPAVGGEVWVSNYDVDIGDRDAVAGGVYLPNNGSNQQEIRFPIYGDSLGFKFEVAATNFVHTLLLAYIGPNTFIGDAFQEGLVRAATMRVVRAPGSLPPGLDAELVELVLESSYDVGPFYDWWNQRALTAREFIAPNLRSAPLPDGGSVGGLYLARLQMAGSAWQKVAVQYPGFLAAFLAAYYAAPGAYRTQAALVALVAQTVHNLGGSDIEGLAPPEWLRRQFVLETATVPGTKLMSQPFPITSGLGGDDFGVFGVQAHAFTVRANGDEVLFSGQMYPIYWSPDFLRFFTAAQDDRMDLTGGYGAVAPNFPDSFGGEPYRTTVDLPGFGEAARSYLPAGAIATAGRPTPNELYGTVSGVVASAGTTYTVSAHWGVGSVMGLLVRNGAFGARITDSTFLALRVVEVIVVRTNSQGSQTVLSRRVAKGPGPLALDLRVDEVSAFAIPGGLRRGLNLFGLPLDPFAPTAAGAIGSAETNAQIARYNSVFDRYDLYPDCGPAQAGKAFFTRLDAARAVTVEGRLLPNTPQAIALRPGWNMVTVSGPATALPADVQVIATTQFPAPFGSALAAQIVQPDFFAFQPGTPDPITGAPETGSYVPAGSFEPGKGYLVRVFTPEGATLLFNPVSRSRQRDDSRAPTDEWGVQVRVSGEGRSVTCIIGGRPGGTRGYRAGEDSEFPPNAGGIQVSSVVTGRRLFRDVRPMQSPSLHEIRIEGLRPGRRYRLELNPSAGRVRGLVLIDNFTRRQRSFRQSGWVTFTALRRQHTFTVQVRR